MFQSLLIECIEKTDRSLRRGDTLMLFKTNSAMKTKQPNQPEQHPEKESNLLRSFGRVNENTRKTPTCNQYKNACTSHAQHSTQSARTNCHLEKNARPNA